jgi:glycosyltransferase involved in cell wall biosynthesis
MTRNYVLISPCRDEAVYLQSTIDTVAGQTLLPSKWIIIDDGSTDDTPEILANAARKYPFIEVIRREDRGRRSVGPGVIDAFYAGIKAINLEDYDFLCKLDCDLELPLKYFERLIEFCENDPWLGTISGKLYVQEDGKLVEERCGDENSVGPTKFYRVKCFQNIDGFVREVCWDGIDGHICRMRGWKAMSINGEDLRVIHLRRMGSSDNGLWTGRLRWGKGKYFMGSTWYYMIAVSLYRMCEKPYIIGGVGIFIGYFKALFQREKRYNNPRYMKFFRQFELESLIFGKHRTMLKYHRIIEKDFPHQGL